MCGIAGIFGREEEEEELVRRMISRTKQEGR